VDSVPANPETICGYLVTCTVGVHQEGKAALLTACIAARLPIFLLISTAFAIVHFCL
jgi:hypothetical protein